jgi:hypothetical protein
LYFQHPRGADCSQAGRWSAGRAEVSPQNPDEGRVGEDHQQLLLQGRRRYRRRQLQLQVIPRPAKEVEATPLLCEDNVAAAVPRAWPIWGPTYNSAGGLVGPVLALLTTEPEELGAVLVEDQSAFKQHLNSTMKRYKQIIRKCLNSTAILK